MIKIIKAVEGNTDFLTSQSFVFALQNQDSEGYLFLIISASSENIFPKVRQLGLEAKEQFLELELPNADKISLLSNILLEQLLPEENAQILVGLCIDDLIYLQNNGLHEVYLLRAGKQTKISQSFKKGELFSGKIKPGDKILLMSTKQINDSGRLIDEKAWNNLPERIFQEEQDDISGELELFLHDLQISYPLALILINNINNTEKADNFSGEPVLKIKTAKTFVKDLARTVSKILSGSKIFFKEKILKKEKVRNKLIVVLLALTIAGVLFAVNYTRNAEKNSQFKAYYKIAEEKLSLAEQLQASNLKESVTALNQSKVNIDYALNIKPTDEQANKLKNEIEEKSYGILKIYPTNDVPVYLSLDLIKKDFTSDKLNYYAGNTLLLSNTDKTLIFLDLTKKVPTILAGQDKLGNAEVADIGSKYGFIYSQDKGILRVNILTGKIDQAVAKSSSWGKIVDIQTFGENIYLLDAINRQVFKYVPGDLGYKYSNSYIKEGETVDMGEPKKFLIDGSVWILTNMGNLVKFTQGVKDYISLEDIENPIKEISTFYLSDTTENLYILDKVSSRLIIFKKSGEYVAQYTGDKFKTTTDFVVDESKKTIYLLENSTIYSIEIKS